MGFLGFVFVPVPNMPKWVPNCAPDVPVRGARARARLVQDRTGTSSAQLGPHFGLFGARRTQKPKETHQS